VNAVKESLIIPGSCEGDYNELIPVGRINPSYSLPRYPHEHDLMLKKSAMWDIDSQFCIQYRDQVEGKFFFNYPTAATVHKAEMRLDEKRPKAGSDSTKELSLQFVDKILEIPLTHKVWTHEQVLEHTDMEKGSGMPLCYLGYQTRADWVNNREFQAALKSTKTLYEYIIQFGVYTKNVGKVEWATMADHVDGKARTFNIPGANVLYAQHMCYAQGNENLKEHVWSMYGFNPFKSGVRQMEDLLLEKNEFGVLKYPIRFAWDVRGYDRKLNLTHVANRRYKYFCVLNKDPYHQKLARWVCQGLKQSFMIMSNGDVVIRVRGNNSGSGMTTADNIEAGFEILTDVLLAAHYEKMKRYPTFEEIYENPVFIYGDDNLGAVTENYSKILDYEWLSDRLLKYHALELKSFEGGYEYPLEKLTFLGFSFGYDRMYVAPKWDLKRMLLPIMYRQGTDEPFKFVARIYSILILVYPYPQMFDEIRNLFIKTLQYYSSQDGVGNGHPVIKSFIRAGPPTKEEMDRFYFGLEGGGTKINLMTTKLTFLYPTIIPVENGGYKCESTVMGDVFAHLTTVNLDSNIAFAMMLSKFGEIIAEAWVPPLFEEKKKSIEDEVKKLDIKISDNDRLRIIACIHSHLFKGTASIAPTDDKKKPKPGSFNPYGNGQTDEQRKILFDIIRDKYPGLNVHSDAPLLGLDVIAKIQNDIIGIREREENVQSEKRPSELKDQGQGSYNEHGNEQDNPISECALKYLCAVFNLEYEEVDCVIHEAYEAYRDQKLIIKKLPPVELEGTFNQYGNDQMDVEPNVKVNLNNYRAQRRRQYEPQSVTFRKRYTWAPSQLQAQEIGSTAIPAQNMPIVRLFGTFNPYGNGQRITRKQFIVKRVASGMTQQQAEKAWNKGPPNKKNKLKRNGPKKKIGWLDHLIKL